VLNTPRDAAIRVTGHADRLGPEPYNDKLSLLRAEAVKKYLTEKGKPVNRIQILAKGEGMPVISCAGDANPETKSCLAPNRRAEIAAKPEVKPAAKSVAHAVTKTATKQKPKATVKTKPAINKSAR
jgi:OOP family OmpA-OmpF porin